MRIRIGDRVKYQNHYIRYAYLGDKRPRQGVEVKEVMIVALAKGTDYHDSDYIVCYPGDYPITDLRSTSFAKHWGIGKKQITERVS